MENEDAVFIVSEECKKIKFKLDLERVYEEKVNHLGYEEKSQRYDHHYQFEELMEEFLGHIHPLELPWMVKIRIECAC